MSLDVLEAARASIAEAARQIRELPDHELVTLVLSASAARPTEQLREELVAKRAPRKARPKKEAATSAPRPTERKMSPGAREVVDLLSKHPKGLTAKEIAEKLNRKTAKGMGGQLCRIHELKLGPEGRWSLA